MKFPSSIYPGYTEGLQQAILSISNTPFVIYDIKFIERTVKNIKKDFSINSNVKLFFAMKANNNVKILKIFKNLELGIDVSSIEELELANQIGFEKISFMNPAFKEFEKIEFTEKMMIDVDSESQLIKFLKIFPNEPFGIRIAEEGDYNIYGVSLNDSIFHKIQNSNAKELLKRIHFHRNNRSVDNLFQSLEVAKKLIREYPSIDTINLGGDLLNVYVENRKKFIQFLYYLKKDEILKNISIIFEPGDALIKYGAMLGTRVTNLKIDKKNNVQHLFLDSSSWICAPWLKSNPIVLLKKKTQEQEYYLHGNTMYPGDVFNHSPIKLPIVEENDILLFPEYGAYTLSNYRSFQLIKRPREYFFEDGIIKQ